MPRSSILGKSLTVLAIDQFRARFPVPDILDIGPGMGTYGRLLKPMMPATSFTAVEVWAPYIKEFDLASVYDRVHVADARCFDYGLLNRSGVALMGDVMEHMTPAEAQDLMLKVLLVCDAVIMSIPIGHWPQGEYMGNPWEAHVGTYGVEDVRRIFPMVVCDMIFKVKAEGDDGIGVFVLTRRDDLRDAVLQSFIAAANIVRTQPSLINCGLPGLPEFTDPAVAAQFHEAIAPYLVAP